MNKTKSKTKPPAPNRSLQIGLLSGLIVIGIAATGWIISMYMRPPAVQIVDLKYVQLLRTAVSNQSIPGIVKIESVLKKKLEANDLSRAQWTHFESILKLAKAGQWEDADRACQKFESAQQYRRR